MKSHSIQFVYAFIVVSFLARSAPGAPSADIVLRSDVRLASHLVRLGDVAEVKSPDEQFAKVLSALVLMPTPAPSTNRFLTRRELHDLVAAHGDVGGQWRISGADRVAVSSDMASSAVHGGDHEIWREAQRRSAKANEPDATSTATSFRDSSSVQQIDLERAISDYLNSVTDKCDAWRIALDLTERHWQQLSAATSVPVCSGGHEPWTGEQRFVLSFSTEKGSAFLPLYAEVARPEAIVVAIREVERGMTITTADVELQYRDSDGRSSGRANLVRSLEQVVGQEASRAIRIGDVLTSDHARAPILVRRGEEIAVISQGGGIRIRATARARQDGSLGELIQVESLESRDRFDARVTGRGEVAVYTAAASKVAGRHVSGRRYK